MAMAMHRLPWHLASLLVVATTAMAAITAANSSTANPQFPGTLSLKHADDLSADLIPLTSQAQQSSITGNLYNTNFSNAANISMGDIAFISCNPADYSGYADSQRVFEDAYGTNKIAGVILYSTVTDYCNFTQNTNQQLQDTFPVMSMTNKQASASLLDAINDLPVNTQYRVQVQAPGGGNSSNNGSGGNNGSSPQQNPLGPSPSTAVAMIILYSITGIITALFLVIIVTGAVRAHRHPERYGPRDVLGRPRQSRARGLGRAILETIPIVKFGEKESPKPTDVELASATDASNVVRSTETDDSTKAMAAATDSTTTVAAEPKEPTGKGAGEANEQHTEGIAPAQSAAMMAADGKASSSHDENLGCSICTEDFEKGQDLRVLPCDHQFHPECVDPWLLNVSGTCPLCRVDLHPVTSNDSSASYPDELAPPLNPETDPSHRRRTAFRDILSLRQRPNATAEERIHALRRLREQRRNRSGEVGQASTDVVTEDPADRRRSRRMSARLSAVLPGRSRRERSPTERVTHLREDTQQQPLGNNSA